MLFILRSGSLEENITKMEDQQIIERLVALEASAEHREKQNRELVHEVQELRKSIAELKSFLHSVKGAWWMLAILATTLSGALALFLKHFKGA